MGMDRNTGFPKEDVTWSGGGVWNWGFAITDVYSTKANVGKGWRCEGSGSVIFRFRGAGTAGEAR